MKINILKILLFIFFFLGRAYTHSTGYFLGINGDEQKEVIPVSRKLSNQLSTAEPFVKVDSIFVNFMKKWDIAGASLAIASKGKLVFTKGYGYSDILSNELVDPGHIFRIASVSKLITAIAIMKLVEDGVLSLQDKVFGQGGIINDPAFYFVEDERVYDISVHHLLAHSGGWGKYGPDPMFNSHYIARKMNAPLPLNLHTIIQYMLSRPLDFSPGRESSYSNFGYALLGEIIERVSGQSYERYVKSAILHPIGIYDMHLAKSFLEEKYPNEVKYYTQQDIHVPAFNGSGKLVPIPYGGNNMELIAATGGWLASPAELLKLILAIDGFENEKEILAPETVNQMVTAGNNATPYGWKGAVNGFWWRTGTLSGTSALVARQSNGISWVALFNTTNQKAARFPRYIHTTMNELLSSINNWPDYDLFEYQVPRSKTILAQN